MARAMCSHSPERVPGPRPLRLPAWDTSWQGNPPVSTSTGSTEAQSTAVTSPRLGTPGQWWASTFDAAGSTSACQATVPPSTACAPISSPP